MGFFGGRIGENMSEKSKVLVVDDKQVERVMMKRILSGTYEVIEAENGKVWQYFKNVRCYKA